MTCDQNNYTGFYTPGPAYQFADAVREAVAMLADGQVEGKHLASRLEYARIGRFYAALFMAGLVERVEANPGYLKLSDKFRRAYLGACSAIVKEQAKT